MVGYSPGAAVLYCKVTVRGPENPESVMATALWIFASQLVNRQGSLKRCSQADVDPEVGPCAARRVTDAEGVDSEAAQGWPAAGQLNSSNVPVAFAVPPPAAVSVTVTVNVPGFVY